MPRIIQKFLNAELLNQSIENLFFRLFTFMNKIKVNNLFHKFNNKFMGTV